MRSLEVDLGDSSRIARRGESSSARSAASSVEESEIGTRVSVSTTCKERNVHISNRSVSEVVPQDRDYATVEIGRKDKQNPVEPAGPPQCGIDIPRLIRRTEYEDALVLVAHAVEFRQQLPTTTLRPADHARLLRFIPSASSSSRNSTHGVLRRAVSKIACRFCSLWPSHMSSTSCEPDREEMGADLAGKRTRKKRLAASGWPVHQ